MPIASGTGPAKLSKKLLSWPGSARHRQRGGRGGNGAAGRTNRHRKTTPPPLVGIAGRPGTGRCYPTSMDEQPRPDANADKFIPGTRPSHPLAAYTGTYRHAGYGDMRVSHAAGGLTVRYNDMPATLKHRHFDVFEAGTDRPEHGEFDGTRLVFQGDEAGTLAGFTALLDKNVRPVLFSRVG